MNEILFFLHIGLVLLFALGALRLGKGALITWVAVQALLANLFVIKQMDFFGFTVTCSDVFAIGSILGLNLLQEYFGKDSAKKATWICFYFMLFFAVMTKMHLLYVPSIADSTHAAYSRILSAAPRLLIASLSVFFIVQQIDIRFFAFLKNRLPRAPLAVRNGCSLFLSQLIDTVLFSFLGLYGLVDSLFDIIVISFAIKVIVIFSTTPLTLLSKKLLRQQPQETS